MSDMFNHELEAMENRDEAYSFPTGQYGDSDTFVPNPLFYHVGVRYKSLSRETSDMFLIDDRWIPKKLCRDHEPENNIIWIHRASYQNILSGPAPQARSENPF